jgi:hypothetical protein
MIARASKIRGQSLGYHVISSANCCAAIVLGGYCHENVNPLPGSRIYGEAAHRDDDDFVGRVRFCPEKLSQRIASNVGASAIISLCRWLQL